MDVVALLKTLGVNNTFYIQFALFVVTYIPLHFMLFKPYFKAYNERVKRTEGNQQASERLLVEADELQVQYESKARELNSNFKAIYDESRTQALHEYDSITTSAREKVKKLLAENKQKVESELTQAKASIQSEVQTLSKDIVAKVLN